MQKQVPTHPKDPSGRYIRINQSKDVWAVTLKCASTSMFAALPQPRQYTILEKGDHVRMIVRDPRDRLVSAWKWFSRNYNSYFPEILRASPRDHAFILDKDSPFDGWVETALRYWNGHWIPQTEVHPRWREFHLIPITELHTLGWGHEKRTRPDNTWEQYYSDGLLELVNEVYKEDIEMWKEATNGIDTGTKRVL